MKIPIYTLLASLLFSFSTVAQIDLELQLSTETTGVQLFQPTTFTVTVTNTSSITATGIEVELPVQRPTVVLVGGAAIDASQGRYRAFGDQIWEVGELAANTSATLTVQLFFLETPQLYAQIVDADQEDTDSTPDNGFCCVANEDDEASFFDETVATDCDFFVQHELDIPISVENSFPNRFRVEEEEERYQLFWEQTTSNQATELAYQIEIGKTGSLEEARAVVFESEAVPVVEVEEDYIILLNTAEGTRDSITIPSDSIDAVVVNGPVIQVSDGFIFGGFLVNLDADQRFTGFLVKVDKDGRNAQFLRIEDIDDTLRVAEVIEDQQGRLFIFWATAGNFTISGVNADFSSAWARKFASDTPSTDVNDIRLSADESTIYVAVEDNRRGEILAYDTATGASNVSASFDLTNILPAEFSTDPIGILPLDNGDILLSTTARETNADNTFLVYALVDQFGTPIWVQESTTEEILVPGARTSDGGYLFVTYNDENVLTVLKTNANGEVVNDCSTESRNVVAATEQLTLPITIAPNPAQRDILISFDANQNSASQIAIYNLQGQLMLQQFIQIQQGTTAIPLRVDELPKGMYIVKVGTNYQPTFFQKTE